jgi:hypothetical protein
MKLLFSIFVLSALACAGLRAETTSSDSTNRPFLAIWMDSEGLRLGSEAPFLRIAIWNDGRIVFARDASKWNHELLEGRIDAARMDELKKAIEKTGVFELKGNCYLVPDAPVDCVMLDFGGKQQMLYWDEREQPGYGINISPKEQHLKFMSCWKAVNRLALEATPKESQPHGEKFQRPPQSWRLKRPIQSE